MSEPAELKLQSDCYRWFHNTFPEYRGLLFHVNNKAKNAIEGNKMKALGTVSGVTDIIYWFKGKMFGIEMKTEVGVLSPNQKAIHEKWTSHGATVYVCRSFERFQEIIHEIHLTNHLPGPI